MKYLKDGEVSAIISNFDESNKRVANNCIFLNKTDLVTLRTNGSVIYGTYARGNDKVRFTHNFKYRDPYVDTKNYGYLKPLVLKAWREAFTPEAQAKMEEVKYVISQLLNKKQDNGVQAPVHISNNQDDSQEVIQEPVIQNTNKKEEVKEMKKDTNMNAMQLAHKIRVELKLEGHYHAQMKIALTLAWKQIKGEEVALEVEEVVADNNVEVTVEEVIPAPPVVEEETEEEVQEPVTEEVVQEEVETVEEIAVQEPVAQENMGAIYLKEFKIDTDTKVGDAIFFYKHPSGFESQCFVMKGMRNLVHIDKEFSEKILPSMIKNVPKDTSIVCYGQRSYLAIHQKEEVSFYCKLRNIQAVSYNPSGDVA